MPFKYLTSFESQRPTENGERGSFEMDVWGAGEDEIALDLGSSVTQNSGTIPSLMEEGIAETAEETPGQVQRSIEQDTQPERIRNHHLRQICSARKYAIVEVARQYGFDTTDTYREEVERRFKLKAKTGLRRRYARYAHQAESSLAKEFIELLEPSDKFEAEVKIKCLIGVILNEPNWHGKVGSPTWRASLNVETRLKRTPAWNDWYDDMISRVRQRTSDSTRDAIEQAAEDQTLGTALEIDDRAKALSNAPEEKGTLPMPEEADSLERLLQDPK